MKTRVFTGAFCLSTLLLLSSLASAAQRSLSHDPRHQNRPSVSDSLPPGMTQNWLNSLLDENGNKIITSKNSSRTIPEDPEGDALQRITFNGPGTGTYLGCSVSSAGDVNGDGYSDIIVGAFGPSLFSGRAYVYYGGLSMNTAPDVIMTGEAADNLFGWSVSSAGDVNGDGYSDVIVGAYGYASNTGRAYVFFGGALMNNSPDVTMTGEATNNFFGFSVSSAGDVNGDGYSDVIAGAYGILSNTGRAYIYFGGPSMNNAADVTITGEEAHNYFGRSVSSAGDVNGDGYSDVIVGAYGYLLGTGRAYVFFGGASMNNIPDEIMTGEATDNLFGISVSSAGDVNGDGYSDMIVGANGYSAYTGRAYVYFGGASMNNAADVTMTGEAVNNLFGFSVSSAGDVNSDGYSDVVVGAYGYLSNTGRAYVYDYFLKNELIPDLSMTGDSTGNDFGFSVASADDVNGDGYSDVIVGAEGYSSYTGRAYIFFGGVLMNNVADVTMTAENSGDQFGISVSSAGDVNGDGYSDVIVGANGYSSKTGRAYIYFGGSSMNNVADVTMTGETAGSSFGGSVSSADDVNGDGYSDVVVGAYEYSSYTGRAYIYFGGASMNNVADVTMTGEAVNNWFGESVSSAGDVNGDGYSDVIIGDDGSSFNAGRAHIYFGGLSMNNVADVTMTGEGANNAFGYSVSSAGDVNGDGYSDVVVGAYGYSSNNGRAYIFFGGSLMNNVADVTVTGEAAANFFGVTVSSAGDVNGDGYSDVVVGASGYSAYTGRVYIYFGGASMNNAADVKMTGDTVMSGFGISVSSAGDVNSDAYSDVIVGAVDSFSTGASYLYLGSAISAKPILNYVKDVPNDQGGKVFLKWARSSYDVIGSSMITDYLVQRSYPPSGGNFSWENVASVPATRESFYTITNSTPVDSSSGNNATFFFRITARTSNPDQFWRSAILSGRSIDNIAPLMVSPFSAAAVSNNVRLTWNRSTAPDIFNYILYRSTSPVIDPDTEPVFATTTDLTYLDTSPLSGIYYYFIVAQDIHNNKSPVAVAESPNMTLNLTVFIEGFYNSGSNSQVSDTITVELRNATSPFAVADVAEALVSSSGSTVLKFGNAPDGNYYIAVRHRNSIETWSAEAIAFSRTSPASYDMSSSASQAFGSNVKQVDASPVRFAIYSGDVNQDGTIDATDMSAIENDAVNFINGYVVTDLTGDDFVDGTDFAIADNNAANFISVIRP